MGYKAAFFGTKVTDSSSGIYRTAVANILGI
jgi:hypothetical protein